MSTSCPTVYRQALFTTALLAAAFAAGCSTSATRTQSDLDRLQRQLPGLYSNANAASTAAGTGGALAVTLSIVSVQAQLVGNAVYFVRETSADNEQLVLAEGIWTLSLAAGERGGKGGKHRGPPRVLQQTYLLKDPRRWQGVGDHPELLLSMLPTDLQALPGCELFWQKTLSGFETVVRPQPCHPGRAARDLWIERQATLTANQLTLTERRTNADGSLEAGDPMELQLTRTAASAAQQ